LLLILHPHPVPWSHLETLPRAWQDLYTIGVYGAIPVVIRWFWRSWEGRTWGELDLAFNRAALLQGLQLGAGGVVFVFAIASAPGWVRFHPPSAWPWIATAQDVVAALIMAWAEEVVFRGLALKTLLRDQGPVTAVTGSALLYALAHFARPNQDLVHSLVPFAGLFATGLLFGYAAWSRRTLWLSIGMHAVWIGFIALSSQYNLWDYAPAGFRWTGAGYPPSGWLTLISMLLCGGWLWWRRPTPTASAAPPASWIA
jgi:membrane protease YdiL (CAAX protease family)